MELNYEKVPDMISGKDLDYLSDMFNWNLGAYKKTKNTISQVQDPEIKVMLEKSSNVFLENTHTVLEVLEGGSKSE